MDRLLAISDIHGCYESFFELLINKVKFSRSDRLILLGDYIDRGDKSKEVIDFILKLKSDGYDVVALRGNHEEMLLNSYADPACLPLWMMNNGETTLESFGVVDISTINEIYTDFLHNLEYFHLEGNFLFVHAGFNDLAEDPFTDIHGMIWESYPSYSHQRLKKFTIIHGHRPKSLDHVRDKITGKSKVIPIDTGCVYGTESGYGFLSALDVFTMELISVKRVEMLKK